MAAAEIRRAESKPPSDIAWGAVWMGYGAALVATAAIAAWALLLGGRGLWWIASCCGGLLFAAGFWAGWRARDPEPLNGALIAALFCATLIAVYFAGEFLAILPDPLPGLPRGDSTFFFVSPLALLAAATVGAIVGGNRGRRRR